MCCAYIYDPNMGVLSWEKHETNKILLCLTESELYSYLERIKRKTGHLS